MSEYWEKHTGSAIFWGVVLVVALILVVKYHGKITNFIRETWIELGKCSWPWDPQEHGFRKYKELIDSTTVVVASVVLLAGFVTGMDFILVKVVGFLTRY